MNQRYRSDAIETDGQAEPAFAQDAELHYQPTTWPGARVPHVWLYDHDTGQRVSTLDLCGQGRFTILTGIGGEPWADAAAKINDALGLEIEVHIIGPRQPIADHSGDWARASEISDSGCILVRPDHHVAWRIKGLPDNPQAELHRVMRKVLSIQ
ncbi:hypothetical protein [Sulfitobacter aestuariivivens]